VFVCDGGGVCVRSVVCVLCVYVCVNVGELCVCVCVCGI